MSKFTLNNLTIPDSIFTLECIVLKYCFKVLLSEIFLIQQQRS